MGRLIFFLATCLLSAPALGITIDFDGTGAPCGFASTTRLTSFGGVTFSGPGGNDGGAILNQCGNFAVNALSGTDFLAFNGGAGLSDGGSAIGPETITFGTPLTAISIFASDGGGANTVLFEAFDSGNFLVGSDSVVVLAGQWLQLSITAAGITSARLTISGNSIAIFDDLNFTPIPEPSTALLLGGGLVGLAAHRRRRKA